MPDSRQSTPTTPRFAMRGLLLTTSALIAFAANSLLCRLALRDPCTDPVGFTIVRICGAALMLWIVVRRRPFRSPRHGSLPSAFWLFAYAITFSFAYVQLQTGTGAILIFGAVQVTMISIGLLSGERPPLEEWCGLLLALAGVVYLVLPGVNAPAPWPATSMIVAGISWGLYSLRGRGVAEPGIATYENFAGAVPMVLVVGLAFYSSVRISATGWIAGLASGAIASGLGYILWYKALAYLTATRAALVQLAAPVLAAIGGVVFLAESFSWRLAIATVAVFGGVMLATMARRRA